ncbi:hypothetical protein U1Q18_007174 [Sarracenia purpurea var. burkii]
MEGSEENPLPKSHQPQHQQEPRLGYQSLPSIEPDPNLDPASPPSPPDDLLHKSTNEKHQNLQIVNFELQTQQSINEELQSRQTVTDELRNQQVINEEFQNLVLKEKDKVSEKGADLEEDVGGSENEGSEKGTDRRADGEGSENEGSEKSRDRRADIEGLENERSEKGGDRRADGEGDERNENNDATGGEGIDYGNDNDYDNWSENEKGYDSGKENTGEEAAMVAGLKDGRYGSYPYPVRPGAEDCPYYMRTWSCKFGSNCKFNHPPRRKNQAAEENGEEKEEYTKRPGKIECKYYLRSGGCKFGKACRYNHSRGRTPVAPIVEFNFLGLPIRSGEKECPYYMRNGSCKYGSNCRFNHPDPSAMGGSDAPSGYGNGGYVSSHGASQAAMSSWLSPRVLNETVPFVPVMLPPTPGVPSPNAEWNGYQTSVYQAPQRRLPMPPAFALNNVADTNFYTHRKHQMVVDEFPERPGQPECSYFLKTGDCKYRSGCKFHHPKNRLPMSATFALSDKGSEHLLAL